MEASYVAYGLELRSAFHLAGMVPRMACDLPSLALRFAAPSELKAAWAPADAVRIWEGRLGDGNGLTVDRGPGGEVLFSDGLRARFLLDARARTLSCVALQDDLGWQRTLLTKVLSCVSLMRGYEGLHACAVRSPWGAVAVAAPTGAGKTTLALELMRRGWPLISDDVLTLAVTPEGVLAFPGTPHMNVAVVRPGGGGSSVPSTTLAVLAGERWVAARETVEEACRVSAICLLERAEGLSCAASALQASPLALAPYMLGLSADADRERARFELYADLMDQASLVHLTCEPAADPARLADLLERTLAECSPALAFGGSA